MFHTRIIFSFFSDLAICNHVTFVTEFISSSWEYRMSEIQNPYDIRHYAMRAWTKSVVTKVTWLHQSDCDFFSFSRFTRDMSQIVQLREKRRLRCFFPAIVQIKQTRLRVSFFWGGPILNLSLKFLSRPKRRARPLRCDS